MGRVAFDFKLPVRLLVVDKNCFPKRACALERQRATLAASGLGASASVLSFFLGFLESIFIDQAALNGTRPNSPSGVKPARFFSWVPVSLGRASVFPHRGPGGASVLVCQCLAWPRPAAGAR
jgi:hypothetical protein